MSNKKFTTHSVMEVLKVPSQLEKTNCSVTVPVTGCKGSEAIRPGNADAVIYLQHPKRGRLQRSNSGRAGGQTAGLILKMRAVVQRVSRAKVTVDAEITGEIGLGLPVLLGVGHDDSEADAIYLAEKIAALRVFEDDAGKMNRSLQDLSGSVLAVSQFTLYGDIRKGRRPSFDAAASPDKARHLYEFFVKQVRAAGLPCETGRFQADMKVESMNEGPVTILMDSRKEF